MATIMSRPIRHIRHIHAFLRGQGRGFAGWGRKASGRRASLLGRLLGRPCVLIEDGFLRSAGRHAPPISLIVDDTGVYYDASVPSLVEHHISRPISSRQAERARRIIAAWQAGGLSKYNDRTNLQRPLPDHFILVADQTAGDLSIRHGGAGEAEFGAMLRAALREHPGRPIIVKTHPDVSQAGRSGHFGPGSLYAELTENPQVIAVTEACDPVPLLQRSIAVYAVTSQLGFEALLWGKQVRCFGMPFYAGWGLTHDELPPPRRRRPVSLEQLVYGALVGAPRYVDPSTGDKWEIEDAMTHLANWSASHNDTAASAPVPVGARHALTG